jgi:hypothetical protein
MKQRIDIRRAETVWPSETTRRVTRVRWRQKP